MTRAAAEKKPKAQVSPQDSPPDVLMPGTRRMRANLVPYQDPWRLLNASEADLRGALDGCPEEGVQDLLRVMALFRSLYTMAARGWPPEAAQLGSCPDEETELLYLATLEESDPEAIDWYRDQSLLFALWQKYTLTPVWKLLRGAKGVELTLVAGTATGLPFNLLEKPIRLALTNLVGANPSRVYVCENCGKIGPAERSRKRFCNTTCRTAAYNKRRK